MKTGKCKTGGKSKAAVKSAGKKFCGGGKLFCKGGKLKGARR